MAKYNARRPWQKLDPRKVVSVFCEGSVTEPTYIRDFSAGFERVYVRLEPISGNSPSRLIEAAINKAGNTKLGDVDMIYCVFDYDRHPDLQDALSLFKSFKPKKSKPPIKLIRSSPCFEYWILIHFQKTIKGFYGAPEVSPCKLLLEELKMRWPGYDKSSQGIFLKIKEKLGDAKRNAKWAIDNCAQKPFDDPNHKNSFTEMHILLEELEQLNEKNSK